MDRADFADSPGSFDEFDGLECYRPPSLPPELEYTDELIESSIERFSDDQGQNSDCYREWGELLDEHGDYEGFLDLDRIMDERFIPFDAMDLSF
jgi:hypothetical protein